MAEVERDHMDGERERMRIARVVERSHRAVHDDRPADDERRDEQPAPIVVPGVHETTNVVTHLVWSTPGRFGAINRNG
ncbi:MAG: hypothetical protein JWN62_818 [Acidimicrobiales bacterium]|nr:hypothetical protein [Acidimicrobiales bacterium]